MDDVADYRPYASLRRGHDAVRDMIRRARTAFPDYRETRDGQVVRQRGIADNLTALRQLGVLPTPPDGGLVVTGAGPGTVRATTPFRRSRATRCR